MVWGKIYTDTNRLEVTLVRDGKLLANGHQLIHSPSCAFCMVMWKVYTDCTRRICGWQCCIASWELVGGGGSRGQWVTLGVRFSWAPWWTFLCMLFVRASCKKWHVLVPLDGFPWFNHHWIALESCSTIWNWNQVFPSSSSQDRDYSPPHHLVCWKQIGCLPYGEE